MNRELGSLTVGRRGLVILALAVAVAGAVLITIGIRAQVSAPQAHNMGSIDTSPSPSPSPSSSSKASSGPKPLGPSRPVQLDIPAVNIHTQVNKIGLAPDGTLAVPQPGPHLNQAAWFKNSPTPGQPGPAIIEGHVDSVEGSSVFLNLGAIKPGNKIHVRRADGVQLTFTVNAVRDYKKAKFPTAVVYGGELSQPTLRLITCSDFNNATHHHEGNAVVFSHLTHVSHRKAAS